VFHGDGLFLGLGSDGCARTAQRLETDGSGRFRGFGHGALGQGFGTSTRLEGVLVHGRQTPSLHGHAERGLGSVVARVNLGRGQFESARLISLHVLTVLLQVLQLLNLLLLQLADLLVFLSQSLFLLFLCFS